MNVFWTLKSVINTVCNILYVKEVYRQNSNKRFLSNPVYYNQWTIMRILTWHPKCLQWLQTGQFLSNISFQCIIQHHNTTTIYRFYGTTFDTHFTMILLLLQFMRTSQLKFLSNQWLIHVTYDMCLIPWSDWMRSYLIYLPI